METIRISVFRQEEKTAAAVKKEPAPLPEKPKRKAAKPEIKKVEKEEPNEDKTAATNEEILGNSDIKTDEKVSETGTIKSGNSLSENAADKAPAENTAEFGPNTDGKKEAEKKFDAAPQIYRSRELAEIPKAIYPQSPAYPESLEDEGIEGEVTLELLISPDGKVKSAKILKSDHGLFSESALRTVRKYRFTPGRLKDGSAVESLIEFTVRFEIPL